MYYFFFFFNDTATTEIYTLSLHDALPILLRAGVRLEFGENLPGYLIEVIEFQAARSRSRSAERDRKSTRLNSSHVEISYAVFCLKKKKITTIKKPPTVPKTITRYELHMST